MIAPGTATYTGSICETGCKKKPRMTHPSMIPLLCNKFLWAHMNNKIIVVDNYDPIIISDGSCKLCLRIKMGRTYHEWGCRG